jgi:hypothetical protein
MASSRDYESMSRHIHGFNEQLATALGASRESVIAQEHVLAFTNAVADDYAADNPRFDRDRFLQASGYGIDAGRRPDLGPQEISPEEVSTGHEAGE